MNTAQLTKLKAAIAANPTWNSQPMTSAGALTIATALNQPSATTVWRTDVAVTEIIDAIDLSKYTPNDVVSGSDSGDTLHRKNGWLLTSQTKQMNLQLMLQGRDRLSCAKPNVRAGLRDAVIQLPTGAGGAATSPGGASGVTVLNVCTRLGTVGEITLAADAAGTDTTGPVTARVMTFEGQISSQDVQDAREMP